MELISSYKNQYRSLAQLEFYACRPNQTINTFFKYIIFGLTFPYLLIESL